MKVPAPDARRALRNKKMARSPPAYVRGNTAQYYQWLHSQQGHALPQGPAIGICGDCHLGKLGPLAGANGRVDMRLRDFDQFWPLSEAGQKGIRLLVGMPDVSQLVSALKTRDDDGRRWASA